MARKIFARRYTQAIFSIALEKQELDRWQADLEKIAVLGEDAELNALLESPKIHFDKKAKLLSELLGDINPLALNLACLLVTRGIFSTAGAIADEYQRLLDSHRGIERAEVVTAVPLEEEEKRKLKEHLGAMVGKKIMLQPGVDESLIGGIVARIGGKLMDGSTRRKLEVLRKELTGTGESRR